MKNFTTKLKKGSTAVRNRKKTFLVSTRVRIVITDITKIFVSTHETLLESLEPAKRSYAQTLQILYQSFLRFLARLQKNIDRLRIKVSIESQGLVLRAKVYRFREAQVCNQPKLCFVGRDRTIYVRISLRDLGSSSETI